VDIAEIVAAVRANPSRTLLALDFDGTLAPIVPVPADSLPAPGAVRALTTLAAHGVRVAVITGRDARTVLELGGLDAIPGIAIAGLYGAETWQHGALRSPPAPAAIEQLRVQLPQVLRTAGADPLVWIEDKRLSLVVHGRLAHDPRAALAPLHQPVAALANRLGLEVHAGRAVIELRLPGYDKGAALRGLVELAQPAIVLYAGDDLGDLPAFAETARLRKTGIAAWSIGIRSAEVPQLADAADVVVDDPAGLVALLTALGSS
jgi:trehalose 6-phosphate phosphatase